LQVAASHLEDTVGQRLAEADEQVVVVGAEVDRAAEGVHGGAAVAHAVAPLARGLLSSTFRLNLSAFCGIWVHLGVVQGLFRRCQGVFRSIRGCAGCTLCQKRLRLS